MKWIPGGTFRMGSDAHYAEAAPAHSVSVDGFWIDECPVTNDRETLLHDAQPAWWS
jgi:sulfatase modifying factor 1